MSKLTSISWLGDHLDKNLTRKELIEVLAAAKEQYRIEIVDAFYSGWREGQNDSGLTGEHYYRTKYED